MPSSVFTSVGRFSAFQLKSSLMSVVSPQLGWQEATPRVLRSVSSHTRVKTFSPDTVIAVTLTAAQKCFFREVTPPFPSLSHHLVARVYESKAEFRSALQHEKEGYTIYKNQVMSDPAVFVFVHCRARTEQFHCKPVPSLAPGEAFPANSFEGCQGALVGPGQNCCSVQ